LWLLNPASLLFLFIYLLFIYLEVLGMEPRAFAHAVPPFLGEPSISCVDSLLPCCGQDTSLSHGGLSLFTVFLLECNFSKVTGCFWVVHGCIPITQNKYS
jgi:hypothetical protein